MTSGEMIKFFIAVIAWDALWLQFLIIPFSRKAETLQKDYVATGDLDAALSFIETQKLIPALATMFAHTREAQADKRRGLSKEGIQQLLQEVDYIPDLKSAQEAMQQSSTLNGLFDSLQNSARHIWKWGLIHIILMLCIPTSHWIPAGYDLIGMVAAIILAFITFSMLIIVFFGFDKQMKQFLDLLKHNRQAG